MPTVLPLSVTVSKDDLLRITVDYSSMDEPNMPALQLAVNVAFPSIVIDELLTKFGDVQQPSQRHPSQQQHTQSRESLDTPLGLDPHGHLQMASFSVPLELTVCADNVIAGSTGTLDSDDDRPLPNWILPLGVTLPFGELVNVLLHNQHKREEYQKELEQVLVRNVMAVLCDDPSEEFSSTASSPWSRASRNEAHVPRVIPPRIVATDYSTPVKDSRLIVETASTAASTVYPSQPPVVKGPAWSTATNRPVQRSLSRHRSPVTQTTGHRPTHDRFSSTRAPPRLAETTCSDPMPPSSSTLNPHSPEFVPFSQVPLEVDMSRQACSQDWRLHVSSTWNLHSSEFMPREFVPGAAPVMLGEESVMLNLQILFPQATIWTRNDEPKNSVVSKSKSRKKKRAPRWQHREMHGEVTSSSHPAQTTKNDRRTVEHAEAPSQLASLMEVPLSMDVAPSGIDAAVAKSKGLGDKRKRSSSVGAQDGHGYFGRKALSGLRRVSSDSMLCNQQEASPNKNVYMHNLAEIPADSRRRLQLKEQARIELAAPESMLVEGTLLLMARPPHPHRSLQDEDIMVLFDRSLFDTRLEHLESTVPPVALKAQPRPPKTNWNSRQKKCREIVAQKGETATALCSMFKLHHFSQDQLLPEARALHGTLRDFVHNKALVIPVDEAENKDSKRARVVTQIVFEEVAKFLVKYHNHPHGDLQELCRSISDDRDRFASKLIDWVGARDKILPGLLTFVQGSERLAMCTLGRAFSSIVSNAAAVVQPETRIYLRQSSQALECWRIQIPDSMAGLYLGNWQTVVKEKPDADPRSCLDAQTLCQLKVLLLQHPDQSYEQIKTLTCLPAGGCVYTLCKLCQEGPKSICKCTMWLRSRCKLQEIDHLMERKEICMDEVIIPEHLSNMVLGPPSYKATDSGGALNLRQFAFGEITAIATSYAHTKK